jgi:membrane associated rhomboid family serine protease
LNVIGVAAGNFFSAAFEDRCAAVAGASGGIFGLLGLFIADMVLNFETLTR